ncbi:MAG: hypothetical protein M1834_009405 [Cirrosporium novae-zelandiae]|nr:MAG: hypothetical protein M1834_009405 [Cirrosporium novae-zelandiae]
MDNLQCWDLATLEAAEAHIQTPKFHPFQLKNLIGNAFVSHNSADWIDSFNPRTGLCFAKIPSSSPEDVDKAVDAADKAFKSWSKTPPSQRSRYLQQIAALIQERHETFAIWESIDQGKPLRRARAEIDRAILNFTSDSPDAPFLGCRAFGCTAVAKPSEVTSVTAFLLAKVFQDAGLPSGVVNMIFGGGLPTGSALVKHPLVKGISFTGGTKTGVQIKRDTIDDIGKHLSLELGGKNPTLVFDDVDLEKAVVTAAEAAFANQGEICLCGSRIYVQRKIFNDFLKSYIAFVKQNFKLGGYLGPVVSLQHYQKIRSYLLLAQKENAHFQLGGVPPEVPKDGYWIEPVILTEVGRESAVMQEEIFGPVVTIEPFDTEEEAIELANGNPNGLSSILLTKDGARMRRVGEQIDAGLVWVNCFLVRHLGVPFGGMKSSGTAREGGEYSRDVFTNLRTLHIPQ